MLLFARRLYAIDRTDHTVLAFQYRRAKQKCPRPKSWRSMGVVALQTGRALRLWLTLQMQAESIFNMVADNQK